MRSTWALAQSFDPFRKSCPTMKRSRHAAAVRVRVRVGAMRRKARVVDENMIVLRKRIHEMKMTEAEWELPAEWMEWERRVYHTSYDAIICDAMAHLQSYLMETRPSFALAMLLLLAFSVSTSVALLIYNLLPFATALFSLLP